jgi:hypothetical protein
VNDGTLLFVNFAVYSWLLLVPVIAVEAWELKGALSLTTGRAAAVSGMANAASTLLCTLAVFGTGWVLGYLDVVAEPHAGEGDVAVLIALVPCFFLSVWAETLVGSALLKPASGDVVRNAFLRANQLGYAMLAIVPVARFVKSALVNQRIIW